METAAHTANRQPSGPNATWQKRPLPFLPACNEQTAPEGRLRRLLIVFGVFFAETINPTGCIEKFLLAGEERMAGGADLDLDIGTLGRPGFDDIAAVALDRHRFVFGMDSFFHGVFSLMPWLGTGR
jgi:hypothetical protein